MKQPVTISNEDLEGLNDGSAAAWRDETQFPIDGATLNALVCEVQNWRRHFRLHRFESGPNHITKRQHDDE